jgi:hypothetical protein
MQTERRGERLKLLKKMPKSRGPGWITTIHFVPHEYELDEKGRICHKVAGYSIRKSTEEDRISIFSERQILTMLEKEIKNGKKNKLKNKN